MDRAQVETSERGSINNAAAWATVVATILAFVGLLFQVGVVGGHGGPAPSPTPSAVNIGLTATTNSGPTTTMVAPTTATTRSPTTTVTTRQFAPPEFPDPGTEPSVTISPLSGPSGTVVSAAGEGFRPGETIEVSFHTEQVATTKADGNGRFSGILFPAPASYSVFAPKQFFVRAVGRSSARFARAPFMLTK